VHRVLKPGGTFFATTFLWGIPDEIVNLQVSVVAVCCNVLQCAAVCCSVLQCAAVCWYFFCHYLPLGHY